MIPAASFHYRLKIRLHLREDWFACLLRSSVIHFSPFGNAQYLLDGQLDR